VAFRPFDPTWLEEPLLPDAVAAYRRLAARRPPVPIAAGEGSNRFRFAEDLLENGGLSFIQIDAGRIGGLDAAHRVRRLAEERGAVYVNHTFKSHLSLAAALHVFAAVERFPFLEYPAGGSELSEGLVENPLLPGPDGLVRLHDAPGLGVRVSRQTIERFLRRVEIRDGDRVLYRPPALD
jgi:L-alanine-DL-glutamate epimerase-like enolase superfamily enzyme